MNPLRCVYEVDAAKRLGVTVGAAMSEEYVAEVEGHKFENYFDWYSICFVITATSCPALSIPCGFTATGLPVGLQMIGPPRGEAPLLSAAALFEITLPTMQAITQTAARMPVGPSGAKPAV